MEVLCNGWFNLDVSFNWQGLVIHEALTVIELLNSYLCSHGIILANIQAAVHFL